MLTTALFQSPRIVLDVGAHQGETAERFTRSFPEARIICLEPIRANFSVLADRARSWPKVACHRLALSDRTEDTTIILQRDTQTHSLEARADSASPTAPRLETIKVTTLDDFAATQQIETIDLLKIDTEGHELAVLNGARGLLTQHRIGSIFIEASLDPTAAFHTQFSAATVFLRPFGFELAAIYDQVMWRNPTKLAYFNALFVSTAPRRPTHDARV